MTYAEIVKKLIGNINPTDDSSRDGERLEHLKTMCDLVEDLIGEIRFVTRDKDAYESSVKEIGQFAFKFLSRLKEEINK